MDGLDIYFLYHKLPVRMDSISSVPRTIAELISGIKSFYPNQQVSLITRKESDVQNCRLIELRTNVFFEKIIFVYNKIANRLGLRPSRSFLGSRGHLRMVLKKIPPGCIIICFKNEDVEFTKKYFPRLKVVYVLYSIFNSYPHVSNQDHLDRILEGINKSEAVVFNSKAIYKYLLDYSLLDKFIAPVFFIQVPINFAKGIRHMLAEVDSNKAKSRYGISSNACVILHVGGTRVVKGKRIIELSLRGYLKTKIPVVFISVGNHQEKRTEDVSPLLKFIHLGRIREDELIELYCIADIGVTPSLCLEPGPFTTIELMLAKTLVIGSALGGNTEFIQHGRNGILIDEPSNIVSWGDQISFWVENTEKRQQIVDNLDYAEMENYWKSDHYIESWNQLLSNLK